MGAGLVQDESFAHMGRIAHVVKWLVTARELIRWRSFFEVVQMGHFPLPSKAGLAA